MRKGFSISRLKTPVRALLTIVTAFVFAGINLVRADTVTVYGAASLGPALNSFHKALQEGGESWASGSKLVLVLGSSGTLARQIERGAPADIFISANGEWTQYLVEKGITTPGFVTPLARNRLALVARKGISIPAGWKASQADGYLTMLEHRGRLALGDPAHVPAGLYAKQALTSLGLWDALSERLAPAKNVRAALALVERGAAPIGIVYESDAKLSDKIELLSVYPESSHTEIAYFVVRIHANEISDIYVEKLLGDIGQAALSEAQLHPID